MIHEELYNKKHIPEKFAQLIWYINKIRLLCQFVWLINFLSVNNDSTWLQSLKCISSWLHFKLATYPAIVIFCGYFIAVYNK